MKDKYFSKLKNALDLFKHKLHLQEDGKQDSNFTKQLKNYSQTSKNQRIFRVQKKFNYF